MMRSGIYVKDYSANRKPKVLTEELKKDAELIRGYSEFMRVLPKKVSAKKKARYEQLLDQCDRLAANESGKIRAMADEEQAEAWIEVTLPFLECTCAAELQLLIDISKAAEYIKIDATEDREICLMIRFPYFDTYISEKNLDRIFSQSEDKN